MAAGPRYIASARTAQKTPLLAVTPLLRVTQPCHSIYERYMRGSLALRSLNEGGKSVGTPSRRPGTAVS
jgi:hypothetical protein